MADVLALCHSAPFIFAGRIESQWPDESEVLLETSLYMNGVIRLEPLHCALSINFRMTSSSKNKMSVVSLNKSHVLVSCWCGVDRALWVKIVSSLPLRKI